MKPYYQKDGQTIYHGDCREVLPLLGRFDLVLTDPPYGVGFKYDGYEDNPEAFSATVLPIVQSLVSSCDAAVFMSMAQMWSLPPARWAACWHKPGSVRRSRIGGWSIWEPVFLYGKGWKFANDAVTLPDCVNHDAGNEHPCPKPVRLFNWLLTHHEGGLALDPFLGSGTTLVAAKQLGKQAIGIELSEAYCEISARRLDNTPKPLFVDEPVVTQKELL